MAWNKGQSGNPKGRATEKPFADALRMEIKAAGSDHKQLRLIARKLLDKAAEGDMQATAVWPTAWTESLFSKWTWLRMPNRSP